MNNSIIKIGLAIILFLCLINMPFGYYQLVRFAAMAGFAYLANSANKQSNKNVVFVYIALAILFQPFIKIALGRTLWNILDVIVGIGLLLSLAVRKDIKKQIKNNIVNENLIISDNVNQTEIKSEIKSKNKW